MFGQQSLPYPADPIRYAHYDQWPIQDGWYCSSIRTESPVSWDEKDGVAG
jgi:hypothetical protein